MTLSLHFVVDNTPDDLLTRGVLYLSRVKQVKYCNVAAGAQLDRGMQLIERIRRDAPHVRIIWRNMDPEDTGILAKMSDRALYDLKVKPYLDWFRRNQVIFMPDNETTGDDDRIRTYAGQETNILRWLHADGLNGAICRFPTGNITESQYVLLKSLLETMLPGDVISPNEYSDKPGGDSGGNLERYKRMWDVVGHPLPTVIGEAGIAVGYDAGAGYLSLSPPLSDQAYMDYLLGQEVWYGDGAIDRCLFKLGIGYSHDQFNLRPGQLEYLEGYYAKQPAPPPIVITPPLPEFPVDFMSRAEQGAVQTLEAGVNVRRDPSLSAPIVYLLEPGAIARFIPLSRLLTAERVTSTVGEHTGLWQPVRIDSISGSVVKGWVFSPLLTWGATAPAYELQALKMLREHLSNYAQRTRQIGLELSSLSDDALRDVSLLDALISLRELPPNVPLVEDQGVQS